MNSYNTNTFPPLSIRDISIGTTDPPCLTLQPLSLPKGRLVHTHKSLWLPSKKYNPWYITTHQLCFWAWLHPHHSPPSLLGLANCRNLVLQVNTPLNSLLSFMIFFTLAQVEYILVDDHSFHSAEMTQFCTCSNLESDWVQLPNDVNLDVEMAPFSNLCSCVKLEIFHVMKKVANKCRAVFLLINWWWWFCFYW